jgi:hypothetical protein
MLASVNDMQTATVPLVVVTELRGLDCTLVPAHHHEAVKEATVSMQFAPCVAVQRAGAGEAEAAGDAKPSCFPRFNSLAAFTTYLDGQSAAPAKSAAEAVAAQGVALLAAAAAAGVALLL